MEKPLQEQIGETQFEAFKSFLTARAGTFQRTSRTTTTGTVRAVDISGCPVTRWTTWERKDVRDHLKGAPDTKIDVSVVEMQPGDARWEDDPEKVGAFSTEQMHVNLYLPRDTFQHFWTAAEATDGATRHIDLALKANERNPDFAHLISVTNAGLIESMQPWQVHPVVTELRSVRERFTGPLRSLLVGLCVFGGVWLLVTIVRSMW